MQGYEVKLDDIDMRMLNHDIKEYGVRGAIEVMFKFINATHVPKIIQTIDSGYKTFVSRIEYKINLIEDEEIKKYYLDKLHNIHQANLIYEQENPPVKYKNTKKESRRTTNNNLFSNSDFDNSDNIPSRKPRTSSKELKEKAKALKIGKLQFKIGV